MKNKYKIIWLENMTTYELADRIRNGLSGEIRIDKGSDYSDIEVEFSLYLTASNNKEAEKDALRIVIAKDLEIFSVIKYNSKVVFTEEDIGIKKVGKKPYLYDAQHPDRQKAIRIIESIPSLAKLNNEDYYAVEDKITEIINKKG